MLCTSHARQDHLVFMNHKSMSFLRTVCCGILLGLIGLISGCSSEQLYQTGQSYQQNQCLRSPNQAQRANCLNPRVQNGE